MKPGVAAFYWNQMPNVERVLDLGCASGDFGRYKPIGVDVYGLELNPALVFVAKNFEFAQSWDLETAQPLPYDDGFFDAVVAKDILEHLQKPWQALAEVRRVLRPGGLVLASVISERGSRTWDDYTHVRGFTMNSARQMFSDTGFDAIKVWRMGGIPLTSRLNL
ncbi:MAG: class I SAM-dependent methyltransferase, partial [Chloroflexi bacterium]|nr:class I SAM-dependent methyltransferase [Chloroflexota bacterium]